MPKEQIRKRGRRKPKHEDNEHDDHTSALEPVEEPSTPVAGPSNIHPARAAMLAGRRVPAAEPAQTEAFGYYEDVQGDREQAYDAEYPFGELDPDLKAYFRNVEEQIRDWEGVSSVGEEREDRQNFLDNVMTELKGHELQVATDPETAVVLERLMPSLGDWGRRVLGQSLESHWETLFRHRFGSHVAQTWLTLAADTLDREAHGVWPSLQKIQENKKLKKDELIVRTMTDQIADLVKSLDHSITDMLLHPHASPPLRLLLVILSPSHTVPSLSSHETDGLIRSKKSGKYRKGQAVQGKSILGQEEGGKGKQAERKVPTELVLLRKDTLKSLIGRIDALGWRSMGLDKVGNPAVQLLIELEIEDGQWDTEASVTDYITGGVSNNTDAEAYLTSLLISPIGSRLFETLLRVAPGTLFSHVWQTHFEGKIGRYSVHPYANFVVARGVSRLGESGMERAIKQCLHVSGGRGMIKTSRTGVLQALVQRSISVPACQVAVQNLIESAVHLPDDQAARDALMPCLMALRTYPTYQVLRLGKEAPEEDDDVDVPSEMVDEDAQEAAAAAARFEGWRNRRKPKIEDSDLAPNMQGSLLLQSMAQMGQTNHAILDSLLAQDVLTLLQYASHPISSRFLDSVLESPAVSPKYRKRLISAFLGHYRELAEDRLGSRVADTIWDRADGFMKERIARSLMKDATALATSQYGRFLVSKMDLHLLERRPDEWRLTHTGSAGRPNRPGYEAKLNGHAVETKVKETPGLSTVEEALDSKIEKKRKRKERVKDEIDELFGKPKLKSIEA